MSVSVLYDTYMILLVLPYFLFSSVMENSVRGDVVYPASKVSNVSIQKPSASFGKLTKRADVVFVETTHPPASHIPTSKQQSGISHSILGETVSSPNSPIVTQTATTHGTSVRKTRKSMMTIALLGDSMMDTLGPSASEITDKLKSLYSDTQFVIKNYGVGGTNLEYAVYRITNPYMYLGASIPSLVSQQPDVVVIESCGYNPFKGSIAQGLDRQWVELAHAIDTIKQTIPNAKIVVASTIAPNTSVFGDGATGLSFTQTDKHERTNIIKQYLKNAVRFAQSAHLPLADAFHASLDSAGNGNIKYINQEDHIHYSDAGRVLIGKKIADAIIAHRLLE